MMLNPDDELRDLLARTDPVGPDARAGSGILDRLMAEVAEPAPAQRRSWVQRHWQGTLLAAAAAASIALATPVLAPGLFTSAQDQSGPAVSSAANPEAPVVAADSSGAAVPLEDGTAKTEQSPSATVEPRLVRSASLVVGTDDVDGQAEAFTAAVNELGGRVVSQNVVTRSEGAPPSPSPDVSIQSSAGRVDMLYPVWPSGPGVYLTVEVPADRFDEAVQAARSTGEVVQLQQSSYDVGTQVVDVEARIAALETSLRTLTGLLDSATSVTDVVALETAISQRQAELDGLKAQQRDLANQTSMSQISLSLMSPDAARDAVDPQPPRTWWESFLDGLADAWAWLGAALLITSPLLIAGAIIWWVKRRRSA